MRKDIPLGVITMEIDKVLALITNFDSPLIIDRVEWIGTAIEFLGELDEKYRTKYRMINKQLETKILESKFSSLFKSYPAGEERLGKILQSYNTDNYNKS